MLLYRFLFKFLLTVIPEFAVYVYKSGVINKVGCYCRKKVGGIIKGNLLIFVAHLKNTKQMSLKSIIKTIGADISKVWAAITGEMKIILPEAISIVGFFTGLISNPLAETVLNAISGGKINENVVNTLNGILPKLLKGLYSAQDVENLSIHDALVHYATVFQGLTDEQRAALLTQLATEYARVTGKDETVTNSELTAIVQYLFSLEQSKPATEAQK